MRNSPTVLISSAASILVKKVLTTQVTGSIWKRMCGAGGTRTRDQRIMRESHLRNEI
jgi:hypothetical protein